MRRVEVQGIRHNTDTPDTRQAVDGSESTSLTVTQAEVSSFFKPVVSICIELIRQQCRNDGRLQFLTEDKKYTMTLMISYFETV